MVSTAVSDLFFNHEHPRFDEAFRMRGEKAGPLDFSTGSDLSNAIYWDAAEFAETIEAAFGVHLDAGELARDFIKRL